MSGRAPRHAFEKLSTAIDLLAIGGADIRKRLNDVFGDLCFLSEDDFPEPLSKDWDWIIGQMTRFGPLENHKGKVWRGAIENTMRNIRCATGVKIAHRMVLLRNDLRDHLRTTNAHFND